MKVLIAPNAFKGSLNALEVAESLEAGLKQAFPDIETMVVPIADGGEGTVDILLHTNGGEERVVDVHNALGEKIQSRYGILKDGKTAVFELAAASGLGQIEPAKLSPMKASTFGTGELIRDALDQGCRRIILGLGGSATTDVGTGILSALGVRFLNESGYEIPAGGGGLSFIHRIDLSKLDPRVKECEFILPCDVLNPLLGKEGSAAIFAPQKGATNEQVAILEENITHFTRLVQESLGVAIGEMPFGGAAGGTSAGLHAFLNARLISGIDFMLHQIGFDDKLRQADVLITAEGRLDHQSLEGKGPYGVARRAKSRDIPALCVAGQIPDNFNPEAYPAFHAIFPIPTAPMSLEASINRSAELLRFTGWQIGRMLLLR